MPNTAPKAYLPNFDSLLEIARLLRSEAGCPWDREQTLASLKADLSEELEEVIEAIDEQDPEHIQEELGDVLFCLALMLSICEEQFDHTSGELFARIIDKIISRHTWVFGDDQVDSAADALELWKRNKQKERATTS